MESKLQIISGKYRGRKLSLPASARPTQNRARIALFNMLESNIVENTNNLVVWDAFAGSGAFGIECISRYAGAKVIFTDVSPESVSVIRKNINTISGDAQSTIVQSDALSAITKFAQNVDIVFVDAPYDAAEVGRAFVNKLGRTVKTGTVVIWEQEASNSVEPNGDTWEVLRDKKYGRARFMFFCKKI